MNDPSASSLNNSPERAIYPLARTVLRVARYTVFRIITLFFAVVVGLYLTILVANFGGYIDKIYEGMIGDTIFGMIRGGWLRDVPEEQREAKIEEFRWQMEEDYGLHEPFLLRTARWLTDGLTLDFGETEFNYLSSYIWADEPESISYLIKLALPYTLVLMGAANLLVFILSLIISIRISRKYGGFWDRLLVTLSPLSSIPAWVYGVWLVILLAGQLHILPFPRSVEILGVENWVEYLPYLAQYAVMPFLAIVLSALFQNINYWRSYFLIYSGEDYVDLARAKGLPDTMLESKYVLRPALPYVVTSFALTMIGLWQSAIALEVLFYWQGIGLMFFGAVRRYDTPMIVAIVVCFAYLLAVTVFVLDIVYALLDPRVQVGANARPRQLTQPRLQKLKAWLNRKDKAPPLELPLLPKPQPRQRRTNEAALAPVKPNRVSAWQRIKPVLRLLIHNPAAVVGGLLILLLVVVSIGTVIYLPYEQTVAMWRRDEKAFIDNPRMVPPAWINYFRKDKLPETLILDSQVDPSLKQIVSQSGGITQYEITYSFHYDYLVYPQDLVVFMEPRFREKFPLVDFVWIRPNGEEISLGRFSVQSTSTAHYFTQDAALKNKLGEDILEDRLFFDPASVASQPLAGDYKLRLTAFTFEEDNGFDARMVLYGRVHGLAGTDNLRRDLLLALLWGTPVALAFGLVGAVATTLVSLLLAAAGAWFGGWLDELIQRISEVNLILPILPIAIMVFVMYSRSIWAILGVVVLLNIFGSGVKAFRAAFLQVKTLPYVEAAQAYGASNWRIILRYLTPRILPVLVPQLVIMVPGYVFFEATLAFLGISDPYLPTWGKMIYDALRVSWFGENIYWIVQPMALLLVTALAFAMLGFTLDRVLNPRLREQ